MKNLSTSNKEQNILTAKNIINELGIYNINFSGYSDTNGVSVYFKTDTNIKIRVSNHSVSNINRIKNELNLSFDKKTLGMNNKIGFESSLNINKLMLKSFNKFNKF